MNFELALSVLSQGLKLWNTAQARKYLKELMELKEEYYHEFNRPDRSDLNLDRLHDRIKLIATYFATQSSLGDDASSSSK